MSVVWSGTIWTQEPVEGFLDQWDQMGPTSRGH